MPAAQKGVGIVEAPRNGKHSNHSMKVWIVNGCPEKLELVARLPGKFC